MLSEVVEVPDNQVWAYNAILNMSGNCYELQNDLQFTDLQCTICWVIWISLYCFLSIF